MFHPLCDSVMTSAGLRGHLKWQRMWRAEPLLQALDELAGFLMRSKRHHTQTKPDDPTALGDFTHADIHC